MVAKLRTALVLLIIGSVSGAAIVGVNSLTEDRIETNRLVAQYEDYVTMFPDLDDVEENDVDDNDVIDKAYTILDADDNVLGTVYRGHDENSQGAITVLVGISGNTIVDMIVSSTENTASYIEGLEQDYISKYDNVPVDEEISYDAQAGPSAGVSKSSVDKIKDAAVTVAGVEVSDPELNLYQGLLEDADSYAVIQRFDNPPYEYEKAIYDEAGAFAGFAYSIPLDDGTIRLILDSGNTFQGFATEDEDAESAYSDAMDAFSDYEGGALADIDHDPSGDTESTLMDAIDSAEALVTQTTRVNHEFLAREEPYMVDGSEAGTLYTGMSEGYGGDNVIQVAIDDAGEIVHIELVLTDDTVDPVSGEYPFDGIQALLIDKLDTIYGMDSITEEEADDAFAGASTTGGSVYDVVNAALEYHNESGGE